MAEAELETRSTRIDPKLEHASWRVSPASLIPSEASDMPAALTEYPTLDGPADYALSNGGRIVGVVEAKRLTVGPQGALTQAERYSRGIKRHPRFLGRVRSSLPLLD